MCSLGLGNSIVCKVCDLQINYHPDITVEKKNLLTRRYAQYEKNTRGGS